MDGGNRTNLMLLGLQITIFGAMMALLAAAGLNYFSVEAGLTVAAAGFVISVPTVLTGRR